jgi:hypothetical protein
VEDNDLGFNSMSFHDREYDVYVMLGDPTREPAWYETTWRHIAAAVDPLMHSARDRAAVRSRQLKAGAGSPNQRAISFGRIGWNAQGHKKWVQASPGSDASKDLPLFIDSEVWAPSWTQCQRERRAPDTYFAIRNEELSPGQQVSFNPICVLAAACDQPGDVVEQGKKAAAIVAQNIGAILRVHCRRPWGYAAGIAFYTNGIGDLIVTGLFKPGTRHKGTVSSLLLRGTWETF